MISLRYLFEKREERFISVATLISALGIAVGVAALIVTMGVVNGFNREIEEKILNVNPHIIIASDRASVDHEDIKRKISQIEGVLETADFLDGQALINVDEKVAGVLIRGIHPNPKRRLIKIDSYLAAGTTGLKGNGAIVGSELAGNFRLKVGDRINILSPLAGSSEEFKVNGIFNSGRYDYDLNLVFLNIEEAKKLLGKDNIVSGVGLKVAEVFKVDSIKYKILSVIRPPYRVVTWKEIDRNLFSALKLEKIVLFLVVALIIFVACFNIISTLIMTVMEKAKDIGILKAIGVTRLGLMLIFLLEGLYISIIGIIIGSGLGLGLCYLQYNYKLVKLPPDIYYIYSVPIQVRVPDTMIIIAAAFILGLLATVYPSLHAARLNPVDALRYE
ncbi:MAG: ABC transporter permease [Candidatus Omnitrophica bacterium]|nr:ABC transporter permease [Candidatus Omnitrophota bacterium]